MTDPDQLQESDPRRHTMRLRRMLEETANHARADVMKVDDPKARALFETTAEVLGGLITATEHYEARSEPAWQ